MSNKDQEIQETVIDENFTDVESEDEQEAKSFDPYEIYNQDESGRIIVPLKHPVQGKNKLFTEVALRYPKGGDCRVAGSAKNDTENGLIMIQRCGGLPTDVVNNMRASDIRKLSEVLNFLAEE